MPTGVYQHSPHHWGWNKGKKWSKETKEKMRLARLGEKNPEWKGDNARYTAFHNWLKRHFGKADLCENKTCPFKEKKYFDWALIKGKNHSHKRENYLKLCRRCHLNYDRNNFTVTI